MEWKFRRIILMMIHLTRGYTRTALSYLY